MNFEIKKKVTIFEHILNLNWVVHRDTPVLVIS